MTRNSHLIKIILAFTAIYLIWGTTYLGIRVAIDTIPPFLMVGARFIIAGLPLFMFLRLRGRPMPRLAHWRSAFLVGGFLLVGGNGFVTWAEQEVPSGIAALIVATVPLWMTVFDWILFKASRPGRRIAFGVILGLVGVALLIGPQLLDANGGVSLGSWAIMILAPLLWSIGSLLSRSADLPDDLFMSISIEMLAGGVLLSLIGLALGEANQLHLAQISPRSWAAFFYLIIFGSLIAFTAYIWLLQNVQATRVGTYSYVNPVIAVFLGWLVLDEPLSGRMIVAAAVIVVAVMLIIRQRGGGHQTQEEAATEPEPTTVERPPALQVQPISVSAESD
jgi:drug/metabolite transporter (DMT)-like permease